MKKTYYLFIATIALSFGLSTTAHACQLIYQTPQQMFDAADAVFLGTVHKVATSSEGDVRVVKASVTVDRYWKGSPSRTIWIESSGIYTCAPAFNEASEGQYYLIYGQEEDRSDTLYHIDMLGMKLSKNSLDEIRSLGDGYETVQLPTVYEYRFDRDLSIGSTGNDVTLLQIFLERGGYLKMPIGIPKGYFGSLTKNALAAYQRSKGIVPAAGYLGPITRGVIMNK